LPLAQEPDARRRDETGDENAVSLSSLSNYKRLASEKQVFFLERAIFSSAGVSRAANWAT
jgi:hypothetical protein